MGKISVKPGDLVITVLTEEDKNDPQRHPGDDFWKHIGLHGVIVGPVTLEDGHPINSWCDWWVLIDGELQAWDKENLQVISETR